MRLVQSAKADPPGMRFGIEGIVEEGHHNSSTCLPQDGNSAQ